MWPLYNIEIPFKIEFIMKDNSHRMKDTFEYSELFPFVWLVIVMIDECDGESICLISVLSNL